MAKEIKTKRRSFESWNAANPVLEKNTIGVISCGRDAGKFKKGDGVTNWRDLPYVERRKPMVITGKVITNRKRKLIAALAKSIAGNIKRLFKRREK